MNRIIQKYINNQHEITIAFVHQYTTEPPGLHIIWVSEGSSLGSYTFRNLHSDKRHWFRVVAIGYHGLRSYSPIVSWVTQRGE